LSAESPKRKQKALKMAQKYLLCRILESGWQATVDQSLLTVE
jgi:hypothetical protein